MNPLAKILMVAALGLAAVGAGVAVVQPGDLGDGDPAPDIAATDDVPTTVDDDPVVTDDDPPVTEDDEIALPAEDPTTTTAAPTTTGTGSGFGAEGAATSRDTADGLADTGLDSMLGLAALLGAAGWIVRRRRDR